MSYKRFTNEQLQRASGIDIVSMLKNQGETLKKVGRVYRWQRYDSAVIDRKRWYRHSREHEPKAEFVPPNLSRNMHRTFAYLIKIRKIDADIVQHFVDEKKIVETAEHHNVAFCGYDENGDMKQMQLRSTIPGNRFVMDIEGSDKQYYFRHIGTSENVYVFEAPIDMLSYITLNKENWVEDNYVCLGGVAIDALKNILDRNENISKVYMCVDKDIAGDKTVKRIGAELDKMGYAWERLLPENKDWNEDLIQEREQAENFELKTEMEMIT